jgi:hypothetical protein
MKFHKRAVVTAIALATLAGGGAAALAAAMDDHSPKTESVTGAIRFQTADGKLRTCAGPDGFYSESPFTSTGIATGDPRLSGNVTLTIKELIKRMPDFTPIMGTTGGSFEIRDPVTNRKKAEAEFHGVIQSDIQYGLIVGKVFDTNAEGDRNSSDFVANYRVAGMNGAPTLSYGGTWTNPNIPAVIQSGRCDTKYQHFSATFPP